MQKQREVRDKLIRLLEREKQIYIAKQIGVPRQIISEFKNGKMELYPDTLLKLDEYLNKRLEK